MNNTKEKIEFNLVHVGSDVWEVYFEGKKLMTGSGASCKNLLEAFAEVSRRSSRLICVKNFTAPRGGELEVLKPPRQETGPSPAILEGTR